MLLKIENVDYQGRGIAHHNGKIIFVDKVLKEEVVEVKIINDQKTYAIAQVKEIKTKSPYRIKRICPYLDKCGGCSFLITTYENSLKLKYQGLKSLFTYYNISNDYEIIPNQNPFHYRNKLTLKIIDGKYGYYESQTHQFVAIKRCLLAKQSINDFLFQISKFNLKNGEITIRSNKDNQIILIINSKDDINIPNISNLRGVILNNKLIYGKDYFIEKRTIDYKVSYDSFFQINEDISTKIMNDVLSFIAKDDICLDLYCGVGFFTLPIAQKCQKTYGIEIVKNAIKNAQENQKINHINNAKFILGKVENNLLSQKWTKVLIDPPRSGIDNKTIKFLLQEEIPTIIYISCNPKTLCENYQKLSCKYQITFLRAYDMFSYTKHSELR